MSSNVHHEPLSVAYSKWDKYDPDVEIMKMENKEKIEKLQTYKKKHMNTNRLSVASVNSLNVENRYNSLKTYIQNNTG